MKNTIEKTIAAPNAANGWQSFGADAEAERATMVEPFAAWLVAREAKTRRRLASVSRHLREVEPFARAAREAAAAPDRAPLVVLEYASAALDVAEYSRELALCERAAQAMEYSETVLRVCDDSAAGTLWQLWLDELAGG
jgi:hypothetical protein